MVRNIAITLLLFSFIVGCTTKKNHTGKIALGKIEQMRIESGKGVTYNEIVGISNDPTYGYSPQNPIKLGGIPSRDLSARKNLIFSQIFSAQGMTNAQRLIWKRKGNCCPFDLPPEVDHSSFPPNHGGLLDIYLVKIPKQRPFRLFVNHYEKGLLYAPMGLGYLKNQDTRHIFMEAMKLASERKLERAMKLMRPLANNGSPFSEYYLGLFHRAKNQPKEALFWMERAATHGLADAQLLYAQFLAPTLFFQDVRKDNEFGLPKPKQSLIWLKKAARNRSPEARRALGYLLRFGADSSLHDPKEAAKWWYLASEQGEVTAQVDYGMALIQGIGVDKDLAEGLKWLKLAQLAGDKPGTHLYVRFSQKLETKTKTLLDKLAEAWAHSEQPSELLFHTQRRAKEGNADALFEYGVMLFNGVLTQRDQAKALVQWALAAYHGHPTAQNTFNEGKKQVGEDIRAKVEKRLSELGLHN